MNTRKMIFRELLERKHQMITSILAIILGMAAVVGINTITHHSEAALSQELDKLGFNLLILPKTASVEDYYSADINKELLPEEYVRRLVHSGLHGMNLLSPKLTSKITIKKRRYTLTGVLPNSELKPKKAANSSPFLDDSLMKNTQSVSKKITTQRPPKTKGRLIHTLPKNEIILGHEAAKNLGLTTGKKIMLAKQTFKVRRILPATGTADDSRIFAHLHTVQKITKKPGLVSVIEIVGCCDRIRKGLVPHLDRLVPQAKVVTINQIVNTQLKTNDMMKEISHVLLIVILLAAGASIANSISANVYERKKEIGILMALGAQKNFVQLLFLGKGFIIGLAGGVGGFICGTIAAILLAPQAQGISFTPLPSQLLLAVGTSVSIALIASYFPARQAAAIDPSTSFREV